MSGLLDGKVAIVTGGASGIGQASAARLIAEGARVMIADLDLERATTVVAANGATTAVECDVTDPVQFEAAVEAAVGEFGGLDTMINNAGLELAGSLTEMSEQDFRAVMEVNLYGTLHGTKLAARAMTASGGGTIVNIASGAALGGVALLGAYCASKAAIVNLSRVAALELRPAGIRVNCVCPGLVRTPMADRSLAEIGADLDVPVEEMLLAKQERWGTAEEIASVVAFLASSESSFVTGAAVAADNGVSASYF